MPASYTRIEMSPMREDFRKLSERARREVIREIQGHATVVQKEAINEAPKGDGSVFFRDKKTGEVTTINLKQAIGVKALTRDEFAWGVGSIQKIIGKRLRRKAGWYAHFVLFGTQGGRIKEGPMAGTIVPPTRANNYLLRAFNKHKGRFKHRVDAAMKRALDMADKY